MTPSAQVRHKGGAHKTSCSGNGYPHCNKCSGTDECCLSTRPTTRAGRGKIRGSGSSLCRVSASRYRPTAVLPGVDATEKSSALAQSADCFSTALSSNSRIIAAKEIPSSASYLVPAYHSM